MELLTKLKSEGGWANVLYDDQVGKVSLVGAGMKSHPGVTAEFTEALRDVDVNMELISTSEIRISVLTREADLIRQLVRCTISSSLAAKKKPRFMLEPDVKYPKATTEDF